MNKPAGDYAKRAVEIENRVREIRNQRGLIGGGVRVILVSGEDGRNLSTETMSAAIDPQSWNIEIHVNLKWKPEAEKNAGEFLNAKKISDGLLCAIEGAEGHEIEHWNTSPRSIENHVILLNAIAEELEKMSMLADWSKASPENLEAVPERVCYTTNAFEDLLANSSEKLLGRSEGLCLFYAEQGRTPFYETFIRANLGVWGDALEKKFLEPTLSPKGSHPDAEKALEKFFAFAKSKMSRPGIQGFLHAFRGIKEQEELARVFTRCFAPLMDLDGIDRESRQNKQKRRSGASARSPQAGSQRDNSAQNTGSGKSSSSNENNNAENTGREKTSGKSEGGENGRSEKEGKPVQGEPKTSPGENPFGKALEDPDILRKEIKKFMEKTGKAAMGPGGAPAFVNPQLAIDIYYEMISPPIRVKAEADKKGLAFPVVPYRKQPYDPDVHEEREISGIILGDDGRIAPSVHTQKYPVFVPLKDTLKGFPDLLIIADCSGSMAGGGNTIPKTAWGDNSPYHFVRIGIEGIIKHLEMENILAYIKMNVTLFSDATVSSGWCDYSALNKVKKVVSTKAQFGGTDLDADEIEKQLAGVENALIILMSDGAINNWEAVKCRVLAAFKPHKVIMLLMGSETSTSRDLRAEGHKVMLVKSASDWAKIAIDATRKGMEESAQEFIDSHKLTVV